MKTIIPFSYQEIEIAYKKDVNLNNLNSLKWIFAGGFNRNFNSCVEKFHVRGHNNPMVELYSKAGITLFSPSEGVCILKRCAEMWINEKGE